MSWFLVVLLFAQAPEESELDKAMREAAAAFDTTGSDAPADSQVQAVKSETEVNGYVMERFTGSSVNLDSLGFSRDLPQVLNLMEANVQLRRPLWKEAFAYADISGFFQQGGGFVERDANGRRVAAADHDVVSLRPILAMSELYLSYSPVPNVNLQLGKRRIVWGPGMANNPSDLLNPPRDPSDPNLQRTGSVVARVEVPTERVTFSFLASPQVLYTENGLPYQFLKYPGYAPNAVVREQAIYPTPGILGQRLNVDPRDNEFHYLLAARVYALIFDSDVNFVYYFSNLYNDSFRNKSRVALTFSRYFFTDWELHLEAMFSEGTQRTYVNGPCVTSTEAAVGCVVSGNPLFSQSKLNEGLIYPRVLVGTRRAFADESTLTIEYLWVSDGYTPSQFQDFVRGISIARQQGFAAQVANAAGGGGGAGTNGAIVPRFSFDPLRRHYLFITYSKPKIKDDWTIAGVLLAGLEDLSGVFIPSVTWNAMEWLNLQLSGFIPIRGLPVNQAEAGGKKYSEYSLFPYDARVFLEARAFY
jgi:hypothetical protein